MCCMIESHQPQLCGAVTSDGEVVTIAMIMREYLDYDMAL